MFLQLLATMLEAQPNLTLVGTASGYRSGLEAIHSQRPDLLIVDLALPDGDGVELLRFLRLVNPQARGLVLSAQAASFVCPADLEPMLVGVVDKTATYDTLQAVLRDCCPAAAAAPPDSNAVADLTARQREILALIGRGLSNKQIAQHTGLSVATVETHRKGIARRLQRSGADLVRFAALQLHHLPLQQPAGPAAGHG